MIEHEFKNSGHLKSPKDRRDFRLHKVNKLIGAAPFIPPSYLTDLHNVPVLYQAKQPACIGHATAAGMMYLDDGAYSFAYSPRFLYALCKRDDGIPDQDGTFYRQALKEAKQYGVCDTIEFSNEVTLDPKLYKDTSLISQHAFDVAKDRLVKSYVAVSDLSLSGLKAAIYQNKVVLCGVKLGKEWWTDTNGNISWDKRAILPVRPPKSIVSGHAILLYGFDEHYVYFRNSWSNTWGDNGDGYFDSSYIPYVAEAWTFMDLAPEVITNLKQQVTLAEKVLELMRKVVSLFIK